MSDEVWWDPQDLGKSTSRPPHFICMHTKGGAHETKQRRIADHPIMMKCFG